MNELEWLAERRPDTEAPDDLATARARTALLEHTAATSYRPAAAHAPRRTRRPRLEFLALAAVLAAGLVIAVGALPSGEGPKPSLPTEPQAQAAIVTLSKHLQSAPAPPGDATLVHRSHHLRNGHDFTGVDLYLDDGRYFYGMTDAELRQDAASGQDMDEGDYKRETAAARTAERDGGKAARDQMIEATFDGKMPPRITSQQSKAEMKARIEKLRSAGIKVNVNAKPASQLSLDDNRVWIGAMDALIAGAGRVDVRAGVMNLLSTIADVHSERDGNTISITNTDFSDHYQETLIVDADSGVIEKMIGGVTGQTPEVTVDYDVRRVTAADVLQGS